MIESCLRLDKSGITVSEPKQGNGAGIDDFLVDYVPHQAYINEFLSGMDDPFLVLNGEN